MTLDGVLKLNRKNHKLDASYKARITFLYIQNCLRREIEQKLIIIKIDIICYELQKFLKLIELFGIFYHLFCYLLAILVSKRNFMTKT